ncbi:hypothetical protein DMO24_02735 [Modestobacter versicolor]|uniref:PKD domain-containing protein n=1 Tax=Modestobacter versicolor TaxID=429133 RepID=A0A323VD87_9ACTN|nr:hypothetical protein DMO24_02735 [Modestobacter versicolor]
MKRSIVATVAALLLTLIPTLAKADCIGFCPAPPTTSVGDGAVSVAYMTGAPGDTARTAFAAQAAPVPYRWRLLTPCQVDDTNLGGCQGGQPICAQLPGRIIVLYEVQRQRVVQPDRAPVDGIAPDPAAPVGQGYGGWANEGSSCVDVTDLNPPPSPDEVFRYFQTLPLPQLTTRQQPPGEALVGLPVIFFTDSPTAQTFTVDIRGFTVVITATATSYAWDTGDGTVLTTTDPGAPYPDQTITHDYSSGTYTASLTTTWGATYAVDGGVQADVPGTTTTQGAPVTFTVLQARTVLTDPYD